MTSGRALNAEPSAIYASHLMLGADRWPVGARAVVWLNWQPDN